MKSSSPRQPLIQLIVPVYNSALYLSECLDSISRQTYPQLRVSLVYTPCADGSYEICRRQVQNDSRFRLIVNEERRMGAANARNLGLQDLYGDYIGFVDSDDVVAPDMFALLLQVAADTRADIAVCRECRQKKELARVCGGVEVFTTAEALTQMLLGQKYHAEVWNKLFRRELIAGMTFEPLPVGEDFLFVWSAIRRSSKLAFVDAPRYFYRLNPNGLTHSYDPQKYQAALTVFETVRADVQADPALLPLVATRQYINQMQAFLSLKGSTPSYPQLEDSLRRWFRRNSPDRAVLQQFGKEYRMLAAAFSLSPEFAWRIYRLYKRIRQVHLP